MRRLVLNASVAIKWFLPDASDESNTPEALDLLFQLRAGEVTFTQPVTGRQRSLLFWYGASLKLPHPVLMT